MSADPRIVGILLAAGAASRFGSPKQLAELDGQPLVLHALDRLLCVPALAEVLVVVGAHGDEVAAVVEGTGWEDVRVVRCPDWEDGLSASLRAGVAAADAAGADAVLVHLADLPRVTPQVIAGVLDHARDREGELVGVPVRAVYGGVDGHPAVLPRSLFGVVAHAPRRQGRRACCWPRPRRSASRRATWPTPPTSTPPNSWRP